jgi:hypothetical protein
LNIPGVRPLSVQRNVVRGVAIVAAKVSIVQGRMHLIFFPHLEIPLLVLFYLPVAEFDIFIIIKGVVMVIINVVGVDLAHRHVFFVGILSLVVPVLADVINELVAHEIVVISLHITRHRVEPQRFVTAFGCIAAGENDRLRVVFIHPIIVIHFIITPIITICYDIQFLLNRVYALLVRRESLIKVLRAQDGVVLARRRQVIRPIEIIHKKKLSINYVNYMTDRRLMRFPATLKNQIGLEIIRAKPFELSFFFVFALFFRGLKDIFCILNCSIFIL